MKKITLFVAVLLSVLCGVVARAQVGEAPVGVAVTIKGLNLSWNYYDYQTLDLSIDALNGYQSVSISGSGDSETAQLTARLEPGKTYFLNISSSDLSSGTLQAVPPPGYEMEIERVPRERYDMGGGGSVRLRVLAPFQVLSGHAGTATALTSGRILWQVALGSLSNGGSAGALAIIDTGSANNWSQLFTPAGFFYEPTSSDVSVFYNPGNVAAPDIPYAIRQIITPEVGVDIIVTSSNQAEVKFYHRSQMVGTSGLRSFSGAPFIWYLINQDGAQPNKVYINCDFRDQDDLGNTACAVVATKHTVLERTGTVPDFTWKADEWYEGSSISRDTRTRSNGTESISVAVPNGSAVTNATRTYSAVPWGEEITQETVGTSDTVATTSTYYTSNDQAGNYGRLKSIATTGGGWEGYEYYDYAGSTADQAGALWKRHRPFKNSDTSVPPNLGQHGGEITTFEYALDAFGRRTRPTLVETAVNGVVTARSQTSYSEANASITGLSNLMLVTATRNDSSADGQVLTTTTKYFREDAGTHYNDATDDFFRMQIHSVQMPGGIKQSYAYQRGTWNGGGSFSLSTNSGADFGSCSIISVINGCSGTGNLYTTHNGYNIEDIYLVADKSTMETTVRDQYARVRRTESYVWHNSGWQSVSWVEYGYDGANLLVSRTHSNGASYTAKYSGEKKLWEQDESGVKVVFDEYDDMGRVRVARRESSGVIGELKTRYTYDAASRLTETKVGDGQSETLTSSRGFDDAGRLRSEAPAGLGTTNVTYNPGARTRTVTPPNSGARTETYFADGQLASVTGSGVVEEYYSPEIWTGGQRYMIVRVGSSTSARYREVWSDWLGRPTKTSRPGWPGQSAFEETNTYDSSTGRLTKTARTGYAPTRYEYDALGQVNRSGLDIGDDGLTLNSSDRITDVDRSFDYDGTNWWLKEETKTYPFSNGNAVTMSVSRKRLSGHAASVIDETKVTDAENNTAVRTVTVNRDARTATIKTSRPGYNDAFEYLTNGFTTSVTRPDGLSFSTTYDGLLRSRTVTDPRTGATTTDYWSGSTLPSQVYSTVGTIYTADYDGLGRKTRHGDPAGKSTRYQYNDRGQLWRQWGNGTYPVEYTYDSTLGDRTGLSTYRSAPAGDATSWPSVGTPDTTGFTYDAGTGLLQKRTDAAGKFVEFTYNQRGQVYERYWARTYSGSRVKATYAYDSNTGELTGVSYNDTTQSVSYSYTRLGQLLTVSDYTGQRTFTYDSSKPWRLQSATLPSFYGSRVFTSLYETTGDVGRPRGYQLGSAVGSTADLEHSYTFTAGGRFETLVGNRAGNSVSRTFRYGYLANSSLIETLSIDGHAFSVSRSYEPNRDLLTAIDSKYSTASVTRYDYTYNTRYQREAAKQSGSAFPDYGASTFTRYTYNDRGELTDAPSYLGSDVNNTSAPLPGRQNNYAYDSIGNRKSSNRTGNAALKESFFGDSGGTAEGGNSLNQLVAKENDSVPVQGTVDSANTTAAVAGLSTAPARQGRFWAAELPVSNGSGPWTGSVNVFAAKVGGGSGGADLIRSETRTAQLAKALQVFSYDDDGNLSSDGIWDYQYDAENRLVRMATTSAAIGAGIANKVMQFRYDYMGRRVMKRDDNASGSERRFLYAGWNVIAETDASATIKRSFTWGLDLVGSLTASGGVGALLQIRDETQNKTLLPTYDGNGNVASLVNADSGALEAAYEYDAFGQLLRCEGTYAKDNPFRFSTKWQDEETGLVYYGLRYYSPSLGRFVNRDPKGEDGGLNLYAFCRNNGVNSWDYLGMDDGFTIIDKQLSMTSDGRVYYDYGRAVYANRAPKGSGFSMSGGIQWVAGAANGTVEQEYQATLAKIQGAGIGVVFDSGGGVIGYTGATLQGMLQAQLGNQVMNASLDFWSANGSTSVGAPDVDGASITTTDGPAPGRANYGPLQVLEYDALTPVSFGSAFDSSGPTVASPPATTWSPSRPDDPFSAVVRGFEPYTGVFAYAATRGKQLAWAATAAIYGTLIVDGIGAELDAIDPNRRERPPGWNSNWEWKQNADGNYRWFDPDNGEWRRHREDKWHDKDHWDYNPWTNWNSPWQNVDDLGKIIQKNVQPSAGNTKSGAEL